jgi:hypothetical protein
MKTENITPSKRLQQFEEFLWRLRNEYSNPKPNINHLAKFLEEQTAMSELVKINEQLPALNDETVDVLLRETARSNPQLRFKEGNYFIGEDQIELGHEYIADPFGWTRAWVKWEDGLITETRAQLVADDRPMPKREELGDTDEASWEKDERTGEARDPWQQQNILPLEDVETGEYLIFVTASVGGRIGVEKLCNFVGRQYKQKRQSGLPVVKLGVKDMPTKYGGTKPRPDFLPIVRWHDLPPIKEDMSDELPF